MCDSNCQNIDKQIELQKLKNEELKLNALKEYPIIISVGACFEDDDDVSIFIDIFKQKLETDYKGLKIVVVATNYDGKPFVEMSSVLDINFEKELLDKVNLEEYGINQ